MSVRLVQEYLLVEHILCEIDWRHDELGHGYSSEGSDS